MIEAQYAEQERYSYECGPWDRQKPGYKGCYVRLNNLS